MDARRPRQIQSQTLLAFAHLSSKHFSPFKTTSFISFPAIPPRFPSNKPSGCLNHSARISKPYQLFPPSKRSPSLNPHSNQSPAHLCRTLSPRPITPTAHPPASQIRTTQTQTPVSHLPIPLHPHLPARMKQRIAADDPDNSRTSDLSLAPTSASDTHETTARLSCDAAKPSHPLSPARYKTRTPRVDFTHRNLAPRERG